ncbi:MAG TPA: tRNA (N(6)-L-threonylcarbamoyladenosine(37)-C(2))-methylthiotransferase MtaB, partial [Anaerolineaceae bacterium]|nr:tRNA (N(6)-L-threonylcarbamoyladenosine(37)-C(2))-methylthiotransferase MtaB [Anaerolineaceae bacterium]
MQKIFFDIVGCRLNQAEIERLAEDFRVKGYEISPDPKKADVIIVNTCCVTHKAAADSRKMVRRYQLLGTARVLATGCWATLFKQEALNDLEVINLVHNTKKDQIADLFSENLDFAPTTPQVKPALGHRSRTRAFLKVQDGCDNRCSYCATQLARGKSRSFPIETVLSDIKHLETEGVKEIVLSGVQLGSWGRDLGLELADLIQQILEHSTIPRIRLSSIEPWEITPRLISFWSNKRMLPHLHIPLQSGSNATLQAMRRQNDAKSYKDLLVQIRTLFPEMAISTDVIVGFPGEGDAEFTDSLAFIESCQFSRGHVFQFSPMEFTEAASLDKQVPSIIKKYRSQIMLKQMQAAQRNYNNRQVGRVVEVLIEGSRGQFVTGLTPDFQRVKLISDQDLHNTIQSVRLSSLEGSDS